MAKKPKDRKKHARTIYFRDPTTLPKLDDMAAKDERSVNYLIEKAVRAYYKWS